MRRGRFGLIQFSAISVVICLAIFSPLLSAARGGRAGHDMNVPPQVARSTVVDRARPEVRVERVLQWDEFAGFDSELASLLELRRAPGLTGGAHAGVREGDEIASLSLEQRGGGARFEARD